MVATFAACGRQLARSRDAFPPVRRAGGLFVPWAGGEVAASMLAEANGR